MLLLLCRDDTDARRKRMLEEVKRSLDPDQAPLVATEPGAALVSRSWLQQWKRKECSVAHLRQGAVAPTQSITCHHAQLLPEQTKRCVEL